MAWMHAFLSMPTVMMRPRSSGPASDGRVLRSFWRLTSRKTINTSAIVRSKPGAFFQIVATPMRSDVGGRQNPPDRGFRRATQPGKARALPRPRTQAASTPPWWAIGHPALQCTAHNDGGGSRANWLKLTTSHRAHYCCHPFPSLSVPPHRERPLTHSAGPGAITEDPVCPPALASHPRIVAIIRLSFRLPGGPTTNFSWPSDVL